MPMTPKEMVRHLQKNGFKKVDGGKGSHQKMKNSVTGGGEHAQAHFSHEAVAKRIDGARYSKGMGIAESIAQSRRRICNVGVAPQPVPRNISDFPCRMSTEKNPIQNVCASGQTLKRKAAAELTEKELSIVRDLHK